MKKFEISLFRDSLNMVFYDPRKSVVDENKLKTRLDVELWDIVQDIAIRYGQ